MSSSFIGKVVDNYRIIENIGLGGMGVVFKAIHVKLDKLFALKMIAPGLAMNENFIKRFQTEAKALAKFEDPNIVRIYDLREYNDQWFIVMEYVDGINLLDIIRKKGAFPLQNALAILKQILKAIGHAHSAGIIHRDLKPNNVMISTAGNVKITDFGLAKDQTIMTNTATVTSGGTLYYMSPEHVKGFQYTDERSDIYSIGMTFYEMITGTVPFKDLQSDFDIRESIIRKDTVKPSVYNDKIPVELEKIVMKSIEKNPEDRYQTTGEMLEEVRKFEAKSPDIESDFTLVEINEPVRHTESEFKFGKLPGPRSSKSGIKSKKYIRNIGIISSLIAMILILMYFFYPSTTPKRKPVKETVRFSQLTLLTQPSSAKVIIDNDSIGKSPINKLSLKPGRYSLKISKTDYFPIDTTVVLKPGNNLSLSFLLKSSIVQNEVRISEKVTTPTRSIPAKSVSNALIKVNSEPGAAEVYINGKFKGNTPLNIADIPPGEYQLTFKKDGYAINQNQVNLKSGQNRDLNVNLSPLTGSLDIITNPPSANVIIDGKKTTDSNTPVKLDNIPVGKHKLEVQKDGYASITEEIEVKEGETVTKTIDLVQQQGKLTIQVRPWGSIFIDDEIKKESADTKYEVTLPVKEYKITVTHPTLGRWEKTISLGANSEEEIIVNFNRNVTVSIAAFDDKGFPLNAEIIIDNETTGKSTPADIKVRPGNHKLSLKLDGYNTEEEKLIFVDKDKSNEHTIILKKTE